MVHKRRIHYTETDKAVMWDRWVAEATYPDHERDQVSTATILSQLFIQAREP